MNDIIKTEQANETIDWAEAVQELRRAVGVGRNRFADMIGVTAMTVRRWEIGTSIPAENAQAILSNLALQIDPEPASAMIQMVVNLASTVMHLLPRVALSSLEKRLAAERAQTQKKQPHYTVLNDTKSPVPKWYETLSHYYALRQWKVLIDFANHFDLDELPEYEKARLLNWLGVAYLKVGQPNQAEALLKEASMNRIVRPTALGNLAAVEIARRNLGRAQRHLEEAIREDPTALIARYNKLAVASLQEDQNLTNRAFDELLQYHPEFQTSQTLEELKVDPDMKFFVSTKAFEEALEEAEAPDNDGLSPMQLMRQATGVILAIVLPVLITIAPTIAHAAATGG